MIGRFLLSVVVAAGVLPHANAQASVDIGPVGLAGFSVETAPGSWSVSGAGNDIWGHRDEFHYLHFNRTADVTVTCRVDSFGPASLESWRKAGIMFRNNNPAIEDQRQAQAMMQVTGWGVAMQTRPSDNYHSVSTHSGYDTSNVWIRLVKSGTTVTGFVKREGEYGWMQYNQEEVTFGPEFFVGIAVTAHTRDALATVEVSNFEISDEVFSLPASPTDVGNTGRAVWVQQVKEGIWSVQAGGSDIGGTSDSFGFWSTDQTGDLTATLHLDSVLRRTLDSKGGLMIRASDDADAPHVSLVVKAGDGICLLSRAAAGGPTTVIPNVGVWRNNVELRLVKTGDSVEASYRAPGAATWYVLGTATAALGTNFKVGHAVTSADAGQHGEMTAGVVEVTV